jgi:pimeloyl-ACP methyl ester carboxylesterase
MSRRARRAGIGLVGAAAAVLGLATAIQPAQAASAASAGYTPPKIHWGSCSDPTLVKYKAQCGFLVVPLDYARPRGQKIKIAVSRVKHTVSAKNYQGVMLVNPGGPGGSGLIYSVLQGAIPNSAGNAYDWIGFDPRGVGSSKPALTCDPSFFKPPRPPYRPTTFAIERKWVQRSKAYAAACARTKTQRALIRHVRTVDSVNDMESIRKALGQRRINYYGFSYGTYLGQVYATLHPDRVRRFVWDSSVNPQRVFYKSNQDQDRAFQRTFNIYFRWLAKYESVYHVGKTLAEVRAKYLATIAALDKHPAKGVLGGDELIDDITNAAYYVYGWVDIAQAYSDYINKGNPDELIAMYKDANPTTPGGDNSYAMYLATQCTDAPWPRSQAKLDSDNWILDQHYDYLTWSNAWFNGPCAYWKAPAHQPVHVTGKKVHAKILMIDETFDPATPYPGNLVVRSLFPTASLIEGKNGSTHAGSLSGVACTDDTIANYLLHGTTPKRLAGVRSDKVCPPVPQPVPSAASAAARTAQSAPAASAALRPAALVAGIR